VLGHFTDVYVSSTIGRRKPDAEAFTYVAGAMDVPTHRIVFFDDNLENIVGAQRCGLQAVHVPSRADVARALDHLGL
jgi:HAD superfamily hydrolase (TIGR01509 family)